MWSYSTAATQTITIVNRGASVRIPQTVYNKAVNCGATIHIWHGSHDTKYKYKSIDNSAACVTCKGMTSAKTSTRGRTGRLGRKVFSKLTKADRQQVHDNGTQD